MSRSKFATDKEIQTNFDKCLKDAVELGIWPPSDQGFDNETNQALTAVAKAYPETDVKLINKAKEELKLQLDGTHAANAVVSLERWLARQEST